MKTTFSELRSLLEAMKNPAELHPTRWDLISLYILSLHNRIISTFLAFKKEIEYMNNTLLCTIYMGILLSPSTNFYLIINK